MIALPALLALAPLALASDVHVVGPGGLPSIADALALASDGDVVLVQAGSYAGFDVAARSVAVVADLGADVSITGAVTVHGLAAGQVVTLKGMAIQGTSGAPAVHASASDGALWIEECELSASLVEPAPPGLLIEDFASVVVRRSTLEGASGSGAFGGPGGPGARVLDSDASFYSCELRGGPGGWGGDDAGCTEDDGDVGGAGLVADGALVRAHASTLRGGQGGPGDYCLEGSPTDCGDGGVGGAGLLVQGAGEVSLLSCALQGGAGGGAGGFLCYSGPSGSESKVQSGTLFVAEGVSPTLEVESPLREAEFPLAIAAGEPGQLIALFASLKPAYTEIPGLLGLSLLAPPVQLLASSVLSASGDVAFPSLVPELGAGVQGLTLQLQVVSTSSAGGVILGEPATLVLLDAAF